MRQMDLTEGVIWKKLLVYAWPVVLSSLLQSAYAITDLIVAGWFIGKDGISAINNASQVMQILTQVILGITTGGNILMGQYFGAKDRENRLKTNTTIFGFAILAGLIMTGVIYFLSRPILVGLKAPTLDEATAYLQICALGIIPIFGYNALSAMLRSVGNSRQPFYCVAVTAVCNIVLDPVLIFGFDMGVQGAALATIISQTVSALLVTGMLVREEGALRLDLRRLAFHAGTLKQILLIGLPAGLQSTVFSLSNVVIQSSINSFGSMVVAGNSASSNLEGFVYTAMNAFAQAAVTFTSQNIGARKYHNLDRVIRNCLLCAVVTGLVLGGGAALAGHQLLRFYSSDAAVIATGAERLRLICGFYLLCGIMDVLASSLRGLGYSVLPMVVSLVGSCLLRLVWIATIFQLNRTPFMLYISYPISWALTALVHLTCLLVVRRKLRQKQPQTV